MAMASNIRYLGELRIEVPFELTLFIDGQSSHDNLVESTAEVWIEATTRVSDVERMIEKGKEQIIYEYEIAQIDIEPEVLKELSKDMRSVIYNYIQDHVELNFDDYDFSLLELNSD